jgi:hypothetical protein
VSKRPLSYSNPADILELTLLGFCTIEEGRAKYQKAGGDLQVFEAFVKQHRRELISDSEAGF